MPQKFHGSLLHWREVAELLGQPQMSRQSVTKAMYRADIGPVGGWPEEDVRELLEYRKLSHSDRLKTTFEQWREAAHHGSTNKAS